jgi:deoxyribodipyrimidine photolyase-related protein
MEWTIDAYDWVMVPNIIGMSQYATDIMMTRPYFSSYNYILRMSNYKKDDWCDKWVALYYNFINKHKKILSKNYAIANQVKNWLNKSKEEKNKLLKIAKDLIKL